MNPNEETFRSVENESELSLSDLLLILRRYWYWFALSVLLCCGVAYVYLQWAPKVYTRTASVLIKDNTKGGALSESAAFEDLNLFNVKRNVDNEILVFKSKQMMMNVARRLHLDISYTEKVGLRTLELYTKSPVILQFPEAEESQMFTFDVVPLSEEEVLLTNFPDIYKDLKVTLNDTVIFPFGKVIVTPSLYYTKDHYNSPITITKNNLEEVALGYSNALQVGLANKMATIINLTLQDVSISRAEDVINTLIAVYNEEAINDKNKVMVNTSEFINERLVIIEQELGNVDADIESYKREQRLTDIQSETGMYLKESSQYNQEEMDLLNQRSLAKYIHEYLMDPTKNSELIPSNTGIADGNIEGQITEYNNSLLKRNRLITNSSERNPVVMDLNNSLSAMRQTIIRTVDNLIVGLDIKINNVRQRESQNIRRISAVPTQQRHVLSIERQQSIKEALYLYLLNKREENALSEAITESNARIIDPATGSKIPVSPKTNIILLASFILGLVIPAGCLWLRTATNTKVHTRKDIEDALSIPFLGEIPMRDKKNHDAIVVHEHGRDPISEAFRIIRTNMDFMRVKTDTQVVLFTSFNPNAGKTFVSSNLAMSIALTNKKVVLVDLDIRKSTLSNNVGDNKIGVTNYLSGKAQLVDQIVQIGKIEGKLDVIAAGPVPPNPSELLLSDRLERLIAELRTRYDYIILDNVPAGVVADATIVNRVADLTIYIVRAGVLDKRALPEIEKLYKQERFTNMSIILNGTNIKDTIYGYRYGYSYGYAYGYGYGNTDEKKKRKKR